jgi:hypothetical protein
MHGSHTRRSAADQAPSSSSPITSKKLTRTERADLAFRYQDWLLTKKVPSGGFRLLYVIAQCFNEENPFQCFPSLEYLAARCERSPSTVWSMLPKLEKIGAIEIVWGSRGSGHPNTYRLPAAFLEFYFGPEKGRRSTIKKPRRVSVSDRQENPDTASKKPRRIGVNHLLATEETALRAVVSIDRVPSTAARDVTDEIDAADSDKNGNSAAGKAAAVHCVDSTAIRIEANPTNSAPSGENMRSAARNGNGRAASRVSELQPGPHEEITMRKRRIETPREQFAKLVNVYPKDKRGNDDENAFDAFCLSLDVGNNLNDLMYRAIKIALAASQGADVPELCEFLVSTVNTVGGAELRDRRSAATGSRWRAF